MTTVDSTSDERTVNNIMRHQYRVLTDLENRLADSDRDNRRLREFIEGLPDGDEIVRLRGLLTRIHGIAAEPRPVNMAVRLENIACIASWERDETYAQLAEEQRFIHGAAADAQQVPEGMALYKGEFVTARMVVERLAEAEQELRGLLRDINACQRHFDVGAWQVRLYQDHYDRINAAIAGAAVQPDDATEVKP